MDYPFYLLLLVWLFSDVVLNTNVSIGQNSGYEDLRECAALCLEGPATYVDVRSFIGCPAQPYGQDACYCAEDLHSSASEYITQCVTMACGPSTADVQSAISVYDNYCFTAIGATPIIAAVAASTTAVAAGNTAARGNTIATTTVNGVVETGSNGTSDPT
jgi:hypothetical protein